MSRDNCHAFRLRPFALEAAVLALLVSITGAWAQNDTTLDELELYATIGTVSVVAFYSGDADGDAVGHLEYRGPFDADFRIGHAVVRLSGNRFAGSILFLEPGTGYEVRIVVNDPDNAGPVTREGLVTTRPDAPPASVGLHWYVDAEDGFDGNPGTAEEPFATIQAGADSAQAGDTVHVRPGLYREQVVPPRGGIAGNPLRFVAEGPGVVLDGSDAGIEAGADWTDLGDGLFWTPFDDDSLYAAVDDLRIYDYQSLTDLEDENGNIGVPGAIAGGFFVDENSSRLYLITPDHTNPASHGVHVAIRTSGFLLDTITDVVAEGFEIRYYDGVGIDVRDSARCWIRNNDIHHINDGIRMRRSMASENVVEGNSIRDTGVFDWPWDSVKTHTAEATGLGVLHGFGNVVRWNEVDGIFNGVFSGAFGDANEEIARDTDVYENVMRRIGDDGLELEGAQRNVRYWENIIEGVLNGISIAPVELGPAFLVRNVVRDYSSHALKVNNGTFGWVFIYHTTAVPIPFAVDNGPQAMQPSLPFGSITARNNIWEANRYVVEFSSASLVGPVDWDFDLLYTHDSGRFVKWLNVRYDDLAEFSTATGLEISGVQVLPEYENAASGDLTPVDGHPAVDAGQVVPGINDALVVGSGPDIGAFERGGIVPGPDPLSCDELAPYSFSNEKWDTWSTSVEWTDVLVGDFDGVGGDDLAARVATAGNWWVSLSTGSGFQKTLWEKWSGNTTWQEVRTGDFNGDGRTDLVGRDADSGDWWVALSNGAAFMSSVWARWTTSAEWADIRVGDFDGDGLDDLVGRSAANGNLWVARSSGSTFTNQVWGQWDAAIPWNDVAVGDLDGDGRDDLVGRDALSGSWWVSISEGESFAASKWGAWSTSVEWLDVQIGDFDGDGDDDLAARNAANGKWWVAVSQGGDLRNEVWGSWAVTAWDEVQTGDFDCNDRTDIIGRRLDTGRWWVSLSSGVSFELEGRSSWSVSAAWGNARRGDFDGNGIDDIAGRVATNGNWWVSRSQTDFP